MTRIKKKYSFVLLEVLIAIALVALFALPLVSFPIFQCKSEINNLKTLELERIADSIYAETLEELYRGKPEWSVISQKNASKKIYRVDPIKLLLDSKKEDVKITKYIWSSKCHDIDEENSKTLWRYINVKIVMEAPFLSNKKKTKKLDAEGKKEDIGTKIFSYKVLAKNSVEQKS